MLKPSIKFKSNTGIYHEEGDSRRRLLWGRDNRGGVLRGVVLHHHHVKHVHGRRHGRRRPPGQPRLRGHHEWRCRGPTEQDGDGRYVEGTIDGLFKWCDLWSWKLNLEVIFWKGEDILQITKSIYLDLCMVLIFEKVMNNVEWKLIAGWPASKFKYCFGGQSGRLH